MARIIPIKNISVGAFLLVVLGVAKGASPSSIDPVGIYVLHSTKEKVTIQRGGEPQKKIYVATGFSGVVKVIGVDKDHVFVDLNGDKGFPSFNQGSFSAVLSYGNNTAVYTPLDYDKSCVITLRFTRGAVIVSQVSDDPNTACGFGHAVAVDGLYKKISPKRQKIGVN